VLDIEEIKSEIIKRLKPLNPNKIILFGSYAYGTPNEDSDIDLYVVTNDDFIPQSYKEDSEIYKKVSTKIRDIRDIVAIDLIVHTQTMYKKALEINQFFVKEILTNGVKLYG
jgi:predicted nucleotidyltransferase